MTVQIHPIFPTLFQRDPAKRRGAQNGQAARASVVRALEQACSHLVGARRLVYPAILCSVEVSSSAKVLRYRATVHPVLQRCRMWIVVGRSGTWTEGASVDVTVDFASDYGGAESRTWTQGDMLTTADCSLEVADGTVPSPGVIDLTWTVSATAGDVARVLSYGLAMEPMLAPYGAGVVP
jgi:hypothetical protein